VHWFRKAINQGSTNAMASLAVMHASGRGVEQDFAEAERLYREAARQGNRAGFYGLGVLHSNGQGVVQDPVEGLAWMLVAATLGDERGREAAEAYGLPHDETVRAVERANVLAREYRLDGVRIEFRNLDRDEQAGPAPNA